LSTPSRRRDTAAWVAAGNVERRVAHLAPGWAKAQLASSRANTQAVLDEHARREQQAAKRKKKQPA
jgi:hypothetical protein